MNSRRTANRFVDFAGRLGDRFHRNRQDWSVRTAFVTDVRDITQVSIEPHRMGRFGRSDVTTLDAGFVADPFVVSWGESWYLFFEVWDREVGRGVIGVASSSDGRSWSWEREVLREEFHLSYPQIIRNGDRVYMVPESWEAGAVRIYEADPFPFSWKYRGDLISHPRPIDASFFVHEGRWWCLVETSGQNDTLRLFTATDLAPGIDWSEHPMSPVVSGDIATARPAGPPILIDETLHRLSQSCSPRYGVGVRAHRIERLDENEYVEDKRGMVLLHPSGSGWNRRGSHHLSVTSAPSPDELLVAIDGY